MRKVVALVVLAGAILFSPAAPAAEDLLLNSHLNFGSNRPDGPLITGSGMERGLVKGKPNYVIIYAERSFNCKRQARRSVKLYEKYRGRVNFVIIDLDRKRSPAQREVVRKYFQKYLPQVVVTDQQESTVYNQSGEVEERTISGILDAALK
jgi:thioredoxin-like negative regulator of GroEL